MLLGVLRTGCCEPVGAGQSQGQVVQGRCGMLKAHVEPKPFVIAERFYFHHQNQNSGESVAMYVAELRHLASHCAFGAYLEEVLRDHLDCGLCSKSTHKRLLSEADLMLAWAVGIAQAWKLLIKIPRHSKGWNCQRDD